MTGSTNENFGGFCSQDPNARETIEHHEDDQGFHKLRPNTTGRQPQNDYVPASKKTLASSGGYYMLSAQLATGTI
jgi:hypothetical protein